MKKRYYYPEYSFGLIRLVQRIGIPLILIFSFLLFTNARAQQTTSPIDGMKDNAPAVHAFTNATIVVSPGDVRSDASLIIRDGIIESIGSDIEIPEDARVWDMQDKMIYPGFIDAYSTVGMQDAEIELENGNLPWNQQIRSQLNAESLFSTGDEDGTEALRALGFTSSMSVPDVGIFRGQAALMSLADGTATDRIIRPGVTQAVSLTRDRRYGFTYPTSPIGVIALIRQTLYDADWYERAHARYNQNPAGLQRPETNAALSELGDAASGNQPLLFEVRSDEQLLRALRFTDEFDILPWVLGSGHEYRLLDVLTEAQPPLILPLAFPDTPSVETPEDALNESMADLRHWYLAPENPARLSDAGLSFSLTTHGLDKPANFMPNLRKAIERGLNKESALAALTSNPAELLGVSGSHGSIESGKVANFIVADGDIFEDGTRIADVWIEGQRYKINSVDLIQPAGSWTITSDDSRLDGILQLSGNAGGSLEGHITINDNEIPLMSASVDQTASRLRIDFSGSELGLNGPVRLTASLSGEQLYGWAEISGENRSQWRAERSESGQASEDESASVEEESDEEEVLASLDLADLRPAMEYGRPGLPEQPDRLLVKNATIWTMGPDGIIPNADLLVENGRVVRVGQDLSAGRNTTEIDASGKHITPGLIDAHLHSGVNGVNEIGNVITAEVRMADVLDIHNIWMYRQLAGGLTTAHVMHGSANPIGGQNVHIKMRWGALSDDLIFEGAPGTVKFALGENPKRVGRDRYPDTRMGVEQMIADRFRMARDYEARWQEWERSGDGIPPRRDLRLDALVDILNGDLLVQSHSYRQDEILMLMRLAEEFDFTIKAFHHGVEAYKVAPELAAHGAGAVVWSDWSSFKIEAYDATVYNARLLREAGVLTSLHSDNSQIASRMNWEAAKMVRAGVSPEDAMAMITIDTAEILGIADRVGSLEAGKDADFVIWSGDPLSTFTKAEQTWVDGRKYFDLEEDALLRRSVDNEREQFIRLILED
jgi:imidazolonepropionase-like amidohydrolase